MQPKFAIEDIFSDVSFEFKSIYTKNGYLDDGTYTAVKVIGLLAKVKDGKSDANLLELISDLQEMEEVQELRMKVEDGSIDTTDSVFSEIANLIEEECSATDQRNGWELDTENLEGVRVRIGEGGFFMLRKSLHDPIISLQIEGSSRDSVRAKVVNPILKLLDTNELAPLVDVNCLVSY